MTTSVASQTSTALRSSTGVIFGQNMSFKSHIRGQQTAFFHPWDIAESHSICLKVILKKWVTNVFVTSKLDNCNGNSLLISSPDCSFVRSVKSINLKIPLLVCRILDGLAILKTSQYDCTGISHFAGKWLESAGLLVAPSISKEQILSTSGLDSLYSHNNEVKIPMRQRWMEHFKGSSYEVTVQRSQLNSCSQKCV